MSKTLVYPDELYHGHMAINNSKIFIELYLDWRNNYLTLEKFCEDQALTKNMAKLIIEDGRLLCHNE